VTLDPGPYTMSVLPGCRERLVEVVEALLGRLFHALHGNGIRVERVEVLRRAGRHAESAAARSAGATAGPAAARTATARSAHSAARASASGATLSTATPEALRQGGNLLD